MPLIDLLLDALSLPWPSKNERARRYERIGCLAGLALGLVISIGLMIVTSSLGNP